MGYKLSLDEMEKIANEGGRSSTSNNNSSKEHNYHLSIDEMEKIANQAHQPTQGENQPSKLDYLKKLLPHADIPIGMNVGAGLLSNIIGRSPEQANMIRNLPQIAAGRETNFSDQLQQGIGEYLPLVATGMGALKGIPGILARIGATGGYGAALHPENKEESLKSGLLAGAAGEALPGVFKGLGSIAEKFNPMKYTKGKISEIMGNYKNAKALQKEAYNHPALLEKNELPVTIDPEKYLNFNKKNLSHDSKDIYDDFLKSPTFGNLHKLQSQIFKDSMRFKNEPAKTNSYQKAVKIRKSLTSKAQKFLGQDPEALAAYKEGARITKDVVSPYEFSPELKRIISNKVISRKPLQLQNALTKHMESLKGEVPQEHYLRQALEDVKSKNQSKDIVKHLIPESLRKWLPKPSQLAQNPAILDYLRAAKIGIHDPLKMGLIGRMQEK